MPNEELQTVLPDIAKWKHQIVRYDDGLFGLHEVYLDDQGAVFFTTREPVSFVGMSASEIVTGLQLALMDIVEPDSVTDMEGMVVEKDPEGVQQRAVDAS